MGQDQLVTRSAGLLEAQQHLKEIATEVARRQSRVLLTDGDGNPLAAVVSADDLRYLEYLDQRRERAFQAMQEISAAFADVPLEELEAKIDEIIAEGRARDREERRSA